MYERACVCVGVCESVRPIRGSALSRSEGEGNNLYVLKPLRRLSDISKISIYPVTPGSDGVWTPGFGQLVPAASAACS